MDRKKLPKKQRKALDQLDESLRGLATALRHGELGLARQLRAVAWDQVNALPPRFTHEQRQQLYQFKLRIRALEQSIRKPRT